MGAVRAGALGHHAKTMQKLDSKTWSVGGQLIFESKIVVDRDFLNRVRNRN
jgi:hypothetical protein